MNRWLIFTFALLLCSCSGNRPFVFTNPSQMGDLYARGELTDQHGNRWDIWIVPGMCDILDSTKEGWSKAGDELTEYGKKKFWRDFNDLSCNSLEFAADSFSEYLIEGIGDDFSKASNNISANIEETPFGWIPRIVANAVWGYMVKPIFRITTAPIGIALGGTGAILLPVGKTILPVVFATGQATTRGILIPVTLTVAHQFTYIFAIPNREPDVRHDGSYGLYIINKKDDIPDDVTPDETVEEELHAYEVKPVEVEDLKRLAQEFIEIKKYIAIYNAWQEQQSNYNADFTLEMRREVEYSSFFDVHRFSKEAKQYYEEKFSNEFSQMWQKMISQLSPRQKKYIYIKLKEAFLEFELEVMNQVEH